MRKLGSLLALALLGGQALAHGDATAEKPGKHQVSTEQQSFGREGVAARVTRTIKITMTDAMRYTPEQINVSEGEVVRLQVENRGKLMHELVMGAEQDLKTHAELMKRNPDMVHSAPYMAHVKPGQTRQIVWEFNRAGEVRFGCLMPGHFEAGMVGRITVAAKADR